MAVMMALGMPLTYDRKGMVKVLKPQNMGDEQYGVPFLSNIMKMEEDEVRFFFCNFLRSL